MTGRLQSLVLAGVCVGLAFQAKMLQAWIVLPALYLAYILAAPAASLERRVGQVALSVLAVVAVSLELDVRGHPDTGARSPLRRRQLQQLGLQPGVPLQRRRPELRANCSTQPGCSQPPVGRTTSTSGGAPTHALAKGPGRFLDGGFGRDAAWLFVPSLVALGGILVARRRRPRTDPWRAGALLWGIWLLLTWSFISSSPILNGYYLAALAPAMAALCGLGFALAWKARDRTSGRAGGRDGDRRRRRGVRRLPGARRRRRPALGHRHQRARHGRGRGLPRPLPATGPTTVGAGSGPRSGRAGAAPRRGVGLGDRRGRRLGALRHALPAGGGHSGRTTQLVSATSPPGLPIASAAARIPSTQSVETYETSAQASIHVLAIRPRIPPRRRVLRPGADRPVAHVHRRRASPARRGRPRPDEAADPQSRHALGPRPLQRPGRVHQPRCTREVPSITATSARRPTPGG